MIPCGLKHVWILNEILQYKFLSHNIVHFVFWVLWIGYFEPSPYRPILKLIHASPCISHNVHEKRHSSAPYTI
jgi:hypothetical protein